MAIENVTKIIKESIPRLEILRLNDNVFVREKYTEQHVKNRRFHSSVINYGIHLRKEIIV